MFSLLRWLDHVVMFMFLRPWYQVTYGIIKSISHMKILSVYNHKSVNTKWNQDLQTKKIQTKLGTNLALSPHHCHKLPLNCVSKRSMKSWWKIPSSNQENQPRHKPSKNSKCTSWALQKKPNNHDPQPRRYTTITKSEIQTNEHQGYTYISNHVMPKSMTLWSHPWIKHLALNVSSLLA